MQASFLHSVAAQLMSPVCLAVIIMSCIPVEVVDRLLKQPQLGCFRDSPTPQGFSPVMHEWKHLLKMSLVILHLKSNL